jgi:hypothetical protein
MKKSNLCLIPVLAFVILLFISSSVKANPDVEVTPAQWQIAPYQSQSIYIDNLPPPNTRRYEFYWIEVRRPDGTVDTLWGPTSPYVTLNPGERLTIKYPDDFISPPSGWTSTGAGSTAIQGKYHVTVVGRTLDPFDVNTEWDVTEFSVVPEFLLGSMIVVSLVFAGLLVLKRRYKVP